LDDFFSMDEDGDSSGPDAEEEEVSLSLDAADTLEADSLFSGEDAPEPEVATLSDSEDEGFFSMDEDADSSGPEIEDESDAASSLSLDAADMLEADSLFGGEDAPEPEPETEAAALPEAADEGLDDFFSMDEDGDSSGPEIEDESDAASSLSLDDADMLEADSLFGGEDAPELEPETEAAALPEAADEGLDDFFSMDEDADSSALEAEDASSIGLGDAEELAEDSFFGEESQSAAEEEPAQEEGIDQEQAIEIKEKLDSLFSFDNEALSDEEFPQGDFENEFIMPPAEDELELDQESQTAEEDIFADFPVQQEGESAEDMADAKEEPLEDNVFAIAQGGEEDSSLFAEGSEIDSPLDEKTDESAGDDADIPALEEDAFVSIQDEPLAEQEDIFALAQQAEADEDFLNALKEREDAADEEDAAAPPQAAADDELVLGKEYEDTEGLFGQLAQDGVLDAFEENEMAGGRSGAEIPEHSAGAASASVFSSLALAAAALTAAPSARNLQQVSELAAAARQEEAVPPNKIILLHLLDSSSAMLAKAPDSKTADSGAALVQELAVGLDAAEEPGKLPEIISRYTAWQQDFFNQLMTDGSRPVSSPDAGLRQLQDEVTQLKQDLISEIRLLRQELGKG
jgi:hypothetical protein